VSPLRPRCRPRRTIPGVLGLALLLTVARSIALDVPYLTGHVNDLAPMLTAEQRERLEGGLRDLERRTGAQVAVLTIPSLRGESLEAYSVKVAQAWRLGRKGVDDGALFLIAKQDRKMRIEVGYGLESRLTDLISRRILDEDVRPRFNQGDFAGGIEAGADAIARVISGEPLPPSPPRPATTMSSVVGFLIVIGLFVIVMGTFSTVAVISPGRSGWFLYLFLVPFYASFLAAILPPYGGVVGCGAWLIAFPILRRWLDPGNKDFRTRHPRLAGFAGASGHSSSGGGWSGGGFSGGGGGFGGGGASGGW
jgi:uncharacterized protein